MRGLIDTCRVCAGKDLHQFFDLGEQPLANSLLDSDSQKETFYPLSLCWCSNCNLVQLEYTADREEVFSHYVWVTGTSKVTRDYAQELFKKISQLVPPQKENYVLELASNDGTFLMPFRDNGYKILGVDPAKNIVEQANKEGIPTICEFFGEEVADNILNEHGPAKVVIARNVMYHVSNLLSFTRGLSKILADDGLAVMEFHYAKIIQEDLHYDSIYHEHLCYYTLKSFEYLLRSVGLKTTHVEFSPINRGNIVVYAKKGDVKESSELIEFRKKEETDETNTLNSWKNFAQRSEKHKDELVEFLEKEVKTGSSIIGWGSSARSSTLLNYCGANTTIIPTIVDMNPLKQGKFTAGSHIPIVNANEGMSKKPETIFILAWNFSEEIMKYVKKEFNYTGSFILPLPNNPYKIN